MTTSVAAVPNYTEVSPQCGGDIPRPIDQAPTPQVIKEFSINVKVLDDGDVALAIKDQFGQALVSENVFSFYEALRQMRLTIVESGFPLATHDRLLRGYEA